MRRLRAVALLSVLATTMFAFGRQSHAEVCSVKTPGFSVELTRMAYTILFEGKPVHVISGNDLLHTIFGGKPPYVSCSAVRSTPCFFAVIVGWKLDLLLGFGPIFGPTGELALNAMRWFPHEDTFTAVKAAGRELEVTFDRRRNLKKRFCWDPDGDEKWRFSSNHPSVALSCDTNSPPGDVSQIILPTRAKAPSSDGCAKPVSVYVQDRGALL